MKPENYVQYLLAIFDIPVVSMIPSNNFKSINDLAEYVRPLKGEEGFVVTFDDGHRIKIKAEEYVLIHKTLDKIKFDRNIILNVLNETLDDILSVLPHEEVVRITGIVHFFWTSFNQKESYLKKQYEKAKEKFGNDRKAIALEFNPQLTNPVQDAPFIFAQINGKDLRVEMLKTVEKACGSNMKYDNLLKWFSQN